MNYDAILRELWDERRRLDRAIERLEAEQREAPRRKSTRGRKSMSKEERANVSKRMKDYWAKRRAEHPGIGEPKLPDMGTEQSISQMP
jgi:hypothetical protein